MGLLDGNFDSASLVPFLNAMAAYGAANPPQAASRLPLAQPSLAYQLSQAAGGYAKGLEAQQQLHALQNTNALGDMNVQGFRNLQNSFGGPPQQPAGAAAASSGLLPQIGNAIRGLFGQSNPTAPSGGLLGQPNATPPSGGLLAPNPASKLVSSETETGSGVDASPSDGAVGATSARIANTGAGDPLRTNMTVSTPAASQPPSGGLLSPSSGPQPMIDLPGMYRRAQQLATFPGGQQMAQQYLQLIQKGLPEGAQLMSDGSIAGRAGFNKFTLDKSMADKGFTPQANGTYAPASGGPADPNYIAQAKGAEPYTLERPGAVRVVNGHIVAANPLAVDTVDAQGHPQKSFFMPPAFAGGAIGSGGTGSGAGGSPGGSNVPPGFKSPASPSASAAPAIGPASAGQNGSLLTVQTGLSPLEHSSAEARGHQLEEYGQKLTTDATNAVNQQFTIDQMRRESGNGAGWTPGKFSEWVGDARAMLNGVGLSGPETDAALANYQAFQKNSMTLVTQATRAVSPRAAVQEMNMIRTALPGAQTSQGGLKYMFDQFSANNDFMVAKNQAAETWRGSHNGTLAGFESAWNQSVSPFAFLVHRMPGEDLATMASNLQQTAAGRALLAKIQQEVGTAQKLGMFNEAQ